MSAEDELLRALEYRAAQDRRARAREALQRGLAGDPEARRNLSAKMAALASGPDRYTPGGPRG